MFMEGNNKKRKKIEGMFFFLRAKMLRLSTTEGNSSLGLVGRTVRTWAPIYYFHVIGVRLPSQSASEKNNHEK